MNLFQQSFEIWQSGGVLMLPLAALAFVIYWTALDLYYQFNNGRLLKASPAALPTWVEEPAKS